MNVTKSDAQSLAERAKRIIAKAREYKEQGQAIANRAVRTMLVAGSAGGLAVLDGRYGGEDGLKIVGVPANLAAALAAHGLALAGAAGDQSDNVAAIGDGALANFATLKGLDVGNKWKHDVKDEKGNSTFGPYVKGPINRSAGREYDAAELERLRNQGG